MFPKFPLLSLRLKLIFMKDKILQKATDMFLSIGYKSVTMDDIAKELSISKKTIYTHFGNKTDLVDESTCQLFEQIEEGINTICSKGLNAIKELFEIKQFVMKQLKDEESSPVYQLQKFFPDIHHELKTKQLKVVNDCILTNIKKGITDKIYRDNLNQQFIANIYYVGVMGIKDEEIFPKEQFKQKQLMEYILDYHIRAIATTKGLEILNKITTNI